MTKPLVQAMREDECRIPQQHHYKHQRQKEKLEEKSA
jgi:hypothetical protein